MGKCWVLEQCRHNDFETQILKDSVYDIVTFLCYPTHKIDPTQNIAPYIYFQVIQVKFLENNEEKVLKILMPVLLYEIGKEIHMNYKSCEGYHYI